MLKAALSGSYVNFGVFRLYGDDALDNALQTFIKLLLSIPHSDLLVSLKLPRQAQSLMAVFSWPQTMIEPFSAELSASSNFHFPI